MTSTRRTDSFVPPPCLISCPPPPLLLASLPRTAPVCYYLTILLHRTTHRHLSCPSPSPHTHSTLDPLTTSLPVQPHVLNIFCRNMARITSPLWWTDAELELKRVISGVENFRYHHQKVWHSGGTRNPLMMTAPCPTPCHDAFCRYPSPPTTPSPSTPQKPPPPPPKPTLLHLRPSSNLHIYVWRQVVI